MEGMWTLCGMGKNGLGSENKKGLWIIPLKY